MALKVCGSIEKSREYLSSIITSEEQRQVTRATQARIENNNRVNCNRYALIPTPRRFVIALALRTFSMLTWNRLQHEACANLHHGGHLPTCPPAECLLFFFSTYI